MEGNENTSDLFVKTGRCAIRFTDTGGSVAILESNMPEHKHSDGVHDKILKVDRIIHCYYY